MRQGKIEKEILLVGGILIILLVFTAITKSRKMDCLRSQITSGQFYGGGYMHGNPTEENYNWALENMTPEEYQAYIDWLDDNMMY